MKQQIPGKSSFLPDFCGVRMVFVVVLIGELLAIVLTLADADYLNWVSSFALSSLFIQWIALASVATLCLTRSWLNTLPDQWTATLSYMLVLVICLLITELAWQLLGEEGMSTLTSQSHSLFIIRNMSISAIVGALALRYFYVQHQWRKQIVNEAEARIQALQARIRPHFLFNCMNTIASLTRKQPRLAEEAIEDLSDLFRASLKDAKQLSTLENEVSLCRRYLRIESHRLGERLQVNWDIDTVPVNARLPTLLLQPLIENAIYHGIELLPAGGIIHIKGKVDNKLITLIIDNPLPSQEYEDQHAGNKLGLDNTEQRIHAFFGKQGKLEAGIHNDRFHVEITIPYHA